MKRAMYAVIVLWAVLTAVYMTNMGRADKVSISTAFTDSVDGEEWCELDTYIEGYGKFGVCYLTQEEKERLWGCQSGTFRYSNGRAGSDPAWQ